MKNKPLGRNGQARTLNTVRSLTSHFYYYRFHEENCAEDVVTHRGMTAPNPKRINPQMIEYELHRLSLHWQALTITYCRDMWGKTYKHLSLVSTNEPLRFLDDDVTTLVSVAKTHGEQNANAKHIYARAMVIMPAVKGKSNIITVLKRHQKDLRLDDRELMEFSSIMEEEITLYEVTRRPQLDLDKEIQKYLDLKLTA